MVKETRSNVYLRKSSRATLKELSEKTCLKQSQIVADWLNALQTIMDKFPETYRITLMSYPTEKNVVTLISPILAGEIQFLATQDFETDNRLSERAVHADIAQKLSKNGQHAIFEHHKNKVKA